MSSSQNLWFIFLGAGLAAAASFLVSLAKMRLDAYSAAVSTLCADIEKVGKLSTDYWLVDPDGVKGSGRAKKSLEARRKVTGLEAEIMARCDAIQRRWSDLKPFFSLEAADEVDVSVGRFHHALTGGTFRDRETGAEPESATAAHAAAFELIVALQKASLECASVWRFFHRWLGSNRGN